jgi:hypothetical protein
VIPAAPWCSLSSSRPISAEIIIRPIQEALDGKVVDWMEKVSEEQY